MFNELEPTVRLAVMKILAAIYESGIIAQIDIRVMLHMFGLTEADFDDDGTIDWTVDFETEGFMESYIAFKEDELDRFNEINNQLNDGTVEFDYDGDSELPEEEDEEPRILH